MEGNNTTQQQNQQGVANQPGPRAFRQNNQRYKLTYNFTGEEAIGDRIEVNCGPIYNDKDFMLFQYMVRNQFKGWIMIGYKVVNEDTSEAVGIFQFVGDDIMTKLNKGEQDPKQLATLTQKNHPEDNDTDINASQHTMILDTVQWESVVSEWSNNEPGMYTSPQESIVEPIDLGNYVEGQEMSDFYKGYGTGDFSYEGHDEEYEGGELYIVGQSYLLEEQKNKNKNLAISHVYASNLASQQKSFNESEKVQSNVGGANIL